MYDTFTSQLESANADEAGKQKQAFSEEAGAVGTLTAAEAAKNKENIKRNSGRLEMAEAKSNQAPAVDSRQRCAALRRTCSALWPSVLRSVQ